MTGNNDSEIANRIENLMDSASCTNIYFLRCYLNENGLQDELRWLRENAYYVDAVLEAKRRLIEGRM